MDPRRAVRASVVAAVSVVATAAVLPSRAKSIAYDDEEPSAPTAAAPAAASTSLAGLFGLPSLTSAMKSGDAAARAAAVERAAEIARTLPSSPEADAARDAAWSLVEGATTANIDDDPDGSLAVRLAAARALERSPRQRAETKKALDPLVRNPEPPMKSSAYVPWGGYGGPVPGPMYPPYPPYPPYAGPTVSIAKPGKRANPELVRYVRETAAMALASRGDQDELLARLRLKDDAETTRAALQALAAFPSSASPLFAIGTKLDKLDLKLDDVLLLERLADPRAADALFAAAQAGSAPVAAAAVRALARLGDARVVAIANAVPSTARFETRVAAAEALALFGEKTAEAAILGLANDPKAPLEAKRLAIRFPSAGLVAAIAPFASAGDAEAIAALGRIGATAKLLEIARDDVGVGRDAAAYQLALLPELDLAAIAEGSAARRRRAVRAGAVRAARLGSASSSMKSDAKALAASSSAEDRSAGVLLLSVLDLDRAREALEGSDSVAKKAAATALLAHPRAKAAEIARAHLAAKGVSEDPDLVRALAGVAARAVDGSAAHDVPLSTPVLSGWLSEDGAASPLAAFLLAARGGAAVSPHVARALASSSYAVRAGALLGLGVSPDGGASAVLARQATTIARPALRRAAIRALAARGASPRLDAIRRLEPDAEARAIAATAKGPRTPLLAGSEVVEVRVDGAPSALATATTSDGLALPVLVDQEGFVFVFRAPAGTTEVSAEPKGAVP